MKYFKTGLSSITYTAFIALALNAWADEEGSSIKTPTFTPPSPVPVCYDIVSGSTTPKASHVDIQFTNPLPAGGTVIFDFSKSTVPSGQINIPTPSMHPDFTLISRTATSFTYQVPNRSADFSTTFAIKDNQCPRSSTTQYLNLPVR